MAIRSYPIINVTNRDGAPNVTSPDYAAIAAAHRDPRKLEDVYLDLVCAPPPDDCCLIANLAIAWGVSFGPDVAGRLVKLIPMCNTCKVAPPPPGPRPAPTPTPDPPQPPPGDKPLPPAPEPPKLPPGQKCAIPDFQKVSV